MTRPPAGPAGPHAGPTAASEQAAQDITEHAQDLGERILALLDDAGEHGLTNGELVEIIGGRDVTVWPRVSGLRGQGRVKDSGRQRPSPKSGRAMTVWVRTTPEEEAEIQEALRRVTEFASEPPGQDAYQAADDILQDWPLGGLFQSRDHLAQVVQTAVNARLARLSRMARKHLLRDQGART